ncbi:MAG: carbonic anhydrase [Planctomycetota bacterium]
MSSRIAVAAVCCLAGRVIATAGDVENDPPADAGRSPDATVALAKLRQGNNRFVAEESMHPDETSAYRLTLQAGQHPFATVLGCADSRVVPELIFDQGFGDLFVIRVAGNVVDPDIAGSIEYAVDHLETPLIVVLGHESCGAVTAALEDLDKGLDESRELDLLLKNIEPGLLAVPKDGRPEDRVQAAVEANVRYAVAKLRAMEDLRDAEREGRICFLGAVYNLRTGRVRFFD